MSRGKPGECKPSDKPAEKVCTCQPVDSGTQIHGENCPLYTTPALSEAVQALIAMVDALPNAADITVDNNEATKPAFEAALAAYEAQSDEEKAVFEATKQFAKLMVLHTALSAMSTMAAGDKVQLIRNGNVMQTFADLNTAANSTALQSGDTLKLLEDVKTSSAGGVKNTLTDITFDLNGKTVDINYNKLGDRSTGFVIYENQTIHIKNGKITYSSQGDNGVTDSCQFINSAGTTNMQNVDMVLDGGLSERTNYRGLSAVSPISVINATNCTFTGKAVYQDAIKYINDATVAANGGKIDIKGGSYHAKVGLRNTIGTITIAAQGGEPLIVSGYTPEQGTITVKPGTVLGSTVTVDGVTTNTYVTAEGMKTFSGQVKTGDNMVTRKGVSLKVTDSFGNVVFKQDYYASTTFDFSTKLLPGTYTLHTATVGYHTLTETITITEDTTKNYTLTPMNQIRVGITNTDGVEVSGVTITASKDGKDYQAWSSVWYEIFMPEAGTYSVSVSRGGYLAPDPKTVAFTAASGETQSLAFEMTEDLFYDIFTADDLVKFSQAIHNGENYFGKTVNLCADIDMKGVTYRPADSKSSSFDGTFEGNGYTIRNLAISGNYEYIGLFDNTRGATIRNLGLVNCDIKTTSTSPYTYIGGIVGRARDGPVIENCYVSGKVAGSDTFNGGLVGQALSMGGTHRIENCYSNVTLRTDKVSGVDTQLTRLEAGTLKNSYYTEEYKNFGYYARVGTTVSGVERMTDPATMAEKLNANITSAGKDGVWAPWTQSGGDYPTFGEVSYTCMVGELPFTSLKSAMGTPMVLAVQRRLLP